MFRKDERLVGVYVLLNIRLSAWEFVLFLATAVQDEDE